jgi:glutamyl-Q tRNA(Asp) synthetase
VPSLLPDGRSFGPAPIKTRFAPSVTGHLHLGHAVNAVYVWGVAWALGGEVVVRLEDHDRGRYRPEYERSILDDLTWLGLYAEGDPISRQREHQDRYESAAQRLRGTGRTFNCECTRRTLESEQGESSRYPGICREKGLTPGPGRSLRFRVDDRPVSFTDLRLGSQHQVPAEQCGDFVLRDAQGQWTYQHCVVVDDLAEGITLVVRGEDILESTGRQILLHEALADRPLPAYFHHPLVTDASGRKLSKKEFANSLGDLRREGWTPERVLGEAAFLGGLRAERSPLQVTALDSLFK